MAAHADCNPLFSEVSDDGSGECVSEESFYSYILRLCIFIVPSIIFYIPTVSEGGCLFRDIFKAAIPSTSQVY
ncbi:hypothetical protein P154DRAFT_522754 [Amniculicola lignicola CBS 123094]|uniref:Uncharacterized protein n=1 Tax=Amniculicola lignicola CBS 123094 TaxID=1392246 RepID=A0A6A5WGV1_9PLEO|nr:hypothetical protein P154DRAFT_522754 [Amniculicola lignicola CBS 123094]